LTAEARAALEAFLPMDELLTRFSPARRVSLPAFDIAGEPLAAEELLDGVDDSVVDAIESLAALCDLLDDRLAPRSLRLPTEDELEAAFAGTLFPWGDHIPDGIPHGSQTAFRGHLEPDSRGLRLLGDPYQVEITRTAVKLGDGGEALCGSYPWPVPWLSFSPSFRLAGDFVENLLFEFLETAHVRPVRMD